MPLWLAYLLCVAAVYRLTRLAVKDDFPPVLWLRDRLAGGWRPLTAAERAQLSADPLRSAVSWAGDVQDIDHQDGNGKTASRYARRMAWVPEWLADLVSCPWCASGWIALAVTAYAWAALDWFGWTLALLWWMAVWAGASLIASKRWA